MVHEPPSFEFIDFQDDIESNEQEYVRWRRTEVTDRVAL
jgi:hypothetical protein